MPESISETSPKPQVITRKAKPRLVHHVASQPISVTECLQKHFGVDLKEARELLHLGAIYSDQKRVLEDRILPKGAYLRIHLSPKRFPVSQINWREVITHEEADFLVANKPFGIPVHAGVENRIDNVLHQLRLFRKRDLFITQRLDVPVAGLMVLAKNPAFQSRFNEMLAAQKVQKRYRALVTAAPSLGRVTHFMEPGQRIPKIVSPTERESWLRCELTVHSVTEVEFGKPPAKLFDVEIELHTGRTHQIRAQLAALGSPILGDRLYGSSSKFLEGKEAIALFSSRVEWLEPGSTMRRFKAKAPWQK